MLEGYILYRLKVESVTTKNGWPYGIGPMDAVFALSYMQSLRRANDGRITRYGRLELSGVGQCAMHRQQTIASNNYKCYTVYQRNER